MIILCKLQKHQVKLHMAKHQNTVGTSTYEKIKRDIIYGALAPGVKLKLDSLKQKSFELESLNQTPLKKPFATFEFGKLSPIEDMLREQNSLKHDSLRSYRSSYRSSETH